MSTAEPQLNATETRPTGSETVEKHKQYLFPAVAMYYQEPLALVRGEGQYVWDDKGDRYLDCFGGVLTVSVGHCHPKVTDAVIEQVRTIQHTSTLYANKPQSDLAEKLYQITPGRLKKSFFTSSGTEADEELIMTSTTGEIAAFMAEPIRGVGGFIVPPPGYFERVAEITRNHGGLFIADEVQTAWGRTGDKWFGIEHWNVEPDIITSAKGLGNGVP